MRLRRGTRRIRRPSGIRKRLSLVAAKRRARREKLEREDRRSAQDAIALARSLRGPRAMEKFTHAHQAGADAALNGAQWDAGFFRNFDMVETFEESHLDHGDLFRRQLREDIADDAAAVAGDGGDFGIRLRIGVQVAPSVLDGTFQVPSAPN